MPEHVQFVPECHVDTALARALLVGRLEFINHQHGIPNVGKVLQTQADTGRGPRFVVGMVDKDKKFATVKSLQRFTKSKQARTGPDCRFRICYDPAQPAQYLVVLEPACDAWIFEAAHAAGLSLADFGLPTTLPAFIKEMKNDEAEENPQLKKLLQAIRQARPNGYHELATFVAEIMAAGERPAQP